MGTGCLQIVNPGSLISKKKLYSSCDTLFLRRNRKGIRFGGKECPEGEKQKKVELDLQSPNLANTLREGGGWAKWAVEIWTWRGTHQNRIKVPSPPRLHFPECKIMLDKLSPLLPILISPANKTGGIQNFSFFAYLWGISMRARFFFFPPFACVTNGKHIHTTQMEKKKKK